VRLEITTVQNRPRCKGAMLPMQVWACLFSACCCVEIFCCVLFSFFMKANSGRRLECLAMDSFKTLFWDDPQTVTFLHLHRGKDPPPHIEKRHPPPPTQCNIFGVLMNFNVNLRFEHVYTPKHLSIPSNFKFLEITMPAKILLFWNVVLIPSKACVCQFERTF